MGNWTSKTVTLPPIPFDGDQVAFTVKRLLTEDMLTLAKFYNQENGTLRFSNPIEVSKVAQEILPKYVVAMDGLLTAEGAKMGAAEFVEASKEFYFVPLVGALFGELISVSTVRAQEKNSVPPSPG